MKSRCFLLMNQQSPLSLVFPSSAEGRESMTGLPYYCEYLRDKLQ
jgi:hypothetical protein